MSCYWYVDRCVARDSNKVSHTVCYHIDLINVKTRERYTTYVESTFKNYANWYHIINAHPKGQIITGLAIKGKYIDADSRPTQVLVTDPTEMEYELKQLWNQ